MKLTYNDGTDLQIQSASIQGDGTLLIKTVSATEEDLRGMFGDELKTRKMVISERSQTVGEYEGYTTLEGITKYTAGIIGIILSKPGETVAEKMDALIRENAEAGKFAATAEMVERAVSTYMTGLSPMHRNIFRGQNLGESITAEQLTAIQDGRFYDLYVGDYWEINGVKYRIADINYWKNVGYPESEEVQKPHILIVPDTTLGSGQMNANNSTSGGYRNSTMKATHLNNIAKALPDTFKNILISHRMFSDGTWITTSVDLMNEVMVHGTYICTDNNSRQTSDTQQLSLFRLCPELKSIGQNYWLRNVAGSQTYTLISQYGDASTDAATSTYGVRPVFAVG